MDETEPKFSFLAQISRESLYESRTWFQRTFGKMESGSVRGSIFTLSATGLGAGFLAIPKVLEWSGIIPGLLVISFSGLLNYFSLYVISKCCFRYDEYHYGTVTEKILGRFWGILIETAIILNSIGLIIVFNIIIGNLIPSILNSTNIIYDEYTERVLILVFLNLIFVLPLGLYRKLASLRYEALFKIISLSYTLIVVIIEFPFFIPENNYETIEYFKIDKNIFNTFASGIFAFICEQNLTKVQSELKNRNLKRMKIVNFRTTLFMDILLSAMSLFGYLSLLNNTPEIIITRKAPESIENDWAIVLARILVSISITISIAINLITCRFSIEKLVFKVEENSPLRLHIGITIVLIAFTLVVAIFVPSVTIMISFIVGVCGSVMVIIIPSLLYLSLTGDRFTSCKSLTILIGAGILSILAFVSIFINLINF